MIYPAILGLLLLVAYVLHHHKQLQHARREALLEGAAVLRQRAVTKWDKNPVIAIEDEQCAQVLERLAGKLPSKALELVEQAA